MRSYRELPLRLFEFGSVYRYEKSGVVHGLTRVRGMTQDDAHIFCTKEQMADELDSLLDFVLDLLARLRPRRLLPRAVDEADRARPSGPTRSGTRPPRRCVRRPRSAASSWCSTRAAARSTARRSRCRPATPSAAPGRCPRSSSTSSSRSASSWSTSAPTTQRHTADHDPPRAVRLGRAVLRGAGRALRRRVPGLAGAGAGAGAPGERPTTTPTPTGVVDRLRAEGFRADLVDGRRARSARASARPSWRSCPTSWWSATTTSQHGTVGVNRRGSDRPERDVHRRRLRRAAGGRGPGRPDGR